MANEVAALRAELNAISLLVGNVVELVDIRKEVEAIRQEKDKIIKQYQSESAKQDSPANSAPKVEQPAKKEAPKVEEKKPEPAQEAPEPVQQKIAEPLQPKAVEKPDPKPNTVKEAPKDIKKKAEAVQEVPKASEKKAAAPVVSGQPPQNQEWKRGDLLSTCCEGYYNLVRKDDNDINWVLLKHESNTKIRAEAIGTGSLTDAVSSLTEKDTGFVYVRFQTGDEESKRAKFVLVSWCGSRAPIMRKAKMSVHKADVKQIFYSSALEVHATEPSDLDENAIRASLIRAGGANYNGQSQ